MLTRVSLDLDGHQKLSDVSLRVFGGVKEKTEHSRGKPPTSHDSRLSQNPFIECPKFIHRQLDLTAKRRNQGPYGLGWVCGASLAFQVFQLRGGKRFTSGIGEQAIENSNQVLKMKSRRSDTSRPRP
jgi:hypothetical protein